MSFVIGIDLGGTAAKLGLVALPLSTTSTSSSSLTSSPPSEAAPPPPNDPLLHFLRAPLPLNREDRTPSAIVALLAEACCRLLAEAPGGPVDARHRQHMVSAIGLGFPGHVKAGGVAAGAANLCSSWKNVPLAALLAAKLADQDGPGSRSSRSTPIFLLNDADAALAAEAWQGAAKGETNVVMLTLGYVQRSVQARRGGHACACIHSPTHPIPTFLWYRTGIGMAAWVDGRPLTGGRGLVEGGHMIVEKDGRACGCGQQGCLETYASATAVVRRAHELGFGVASEKEQEEENQDAGLTAKDVFDAAFREEPDPRAVQVVAEAADYLGLGCVNVVRMLDPDVLLLGGGMSGAGDRFLALVHAAFRKYGWTILPNDVRMAEAALGGERAGVLGAARAAAGLVGTVE